ncbi:MAG TPA: beta-ketoacyl synthase chain length factor [Pseudobdellovibrionaceae bacterium]|nr:beta-ketoacyl synthase chain length factor [Pseudobdellovibrionaceae bacterium]
MKNLVLVAEAVCEAKDVRLDELDARFRKATMNMALTTLCARKVLERIPDIPKEQISLLVGTHFGEIESTLEFLIGVHETHTPRPLLFQNSLHNSTLGFATIQLGLTGPAMTVSSDRETVPAVLELADTLSEITPAVLVCIVDVIPDALREEYLAQHPFLERSLNKARCNAYLRPADVQKFGLQPLAGGPL